jgi:signal transduction histidine kinase
MRLERTAVNVSDLVTQASDVVWWMISAKGHSVEMRLDEPLLVTGDAVRLKQAFVGLISNAAKFTPDDGHIAVTAAREGNEVVIRIRDDGSGIAPDFIPMVFEQFTGDLAGASGARPAMGTGLSQVRVIVASHGGSVTARSRGIGRGAEFVVRLPAAGLPDSPA